MQPTDNQFDFIKVAVPTDSQEKALLLPLFTYCRRTELIPACGLDVTFLFFLVFPAENFQCLLRDPLQFKGLSSKNQKKNRKNLIELLFAKI